MKCLILILPLFVTACAVPDGGGLAQSRAAIPWEESMVRSASFNSRSDKEILYLGFAESGNDVAATIGERNGWITCPGWVWSIDSRGRLVFDEGSGHRSDALELLDFSETEVTVRIGKEITEYQRSVK